MNIKRFTLFSAASLIALVGVFSTQSNEKEVYFPRTETLFKQKQQLASGYHEYMNKIRNNKETGFISTAEVQTARKAADKLGKNNKALDINWHFKGPDNVGGRTRALIVDRNDSNHIFAGGVSGGLWESFNGAISWQAYDNDFKFSNVSCIAQASDGTFYVGTGNTFDANNRNGPSNNKDRGSRFVGTGLFKLTGNGNSVLLKGPTVSNNFNAEWAYVNDIKVDPNNPQRILVAMDRGLRESTDGGLNFDPLLPIANCMNVEITSTGTIVASYFGSIYTSTNGGVNFSQTSFNDAGRIELAVAPSNQNIMYASIARSNGCLLGVYRSIDGGLNWNKLSNTPDYFRVASQCQGYYDNEIAVFPDNPGKILVGGIGLLVWNQSSTDPAPVEGEWKVIATTNEFNVDGTRSQFYVHADKHKFVFNPMNPKTVFLGTDGGVAVSFNIDEPVPTYSTSNFGYNVTQFYDIGVGPKDQVTAGSQDNGTQFIGIPYNSGKSAIEVRGGDGFDTDLFTINSTLGIASLYYGDIRRLQGLSTTLTGLTPNTATIYTGSLLDICGGESAANTGFLCSPSTFYTSTSIWESFNHSETKDSVIVQQELKALPPVKAGTIIPYNSKNNRIPLEGMLTVDQKPNDTLIGDIPTVKKLLNKGDVTSIVTSAFDTLIFDLITNQIRFNLRGGATDVRSLVFKKEELYSNVFVENENGPKLKLKVDSSVSNGGTVSYFVNYDQAQVTFYYEFEFPDIVQSMVSLASVRGRVVTAERNVWITQDVLKGGDIRWFKVAGRSSSPNPMPYEDALSNVFSRDGNHLFIGTELGKLMRIDNLNDIDASQIPITADDEFVSSSITSVTQIANFASGTNDLSQAVTGIAVDPQNANNVIVTLGNYGNNSYIRRSTNALSANPTFEIIDGVGANRLPLAPAYDAIIDRKNPNRVLLATEFGVFGTDNAFTTSTILDTTSNTNKLDVHWTEENSGLGRAPVFSIQQMVFGATEGAINEGKVYIGTHGRGVFETSQLVGVEDFVSRQKNTEEPSLKLYPNPVRDNAKLAIYITKPSSVRVQVYSIKGQLVKDFGPANLKKGDNVVDVNLSDLTNGTYIIRLTDNGRSTSSKFIKQ